MALKPSAISVTKHDHDITCIELLGDVIVDEQTMTDLEKHARAAIAGSDSPKLIVSFKDVSYVASGVIGKLIGLSIAARAKGARIRIAATSDAVRSLFDVTKTAHLYDFCDDVNAAIASFGQAEGGEG